MLDVTVKSHNPAYIDSSAIFVIYLEFWVFISVIAMIKSLPSAVLCAVHLVCSSGSQH